MRTVVKSLLLLMLIEAPAASAQIIERIPPLQPVSIAYLKAAASYRGRQIDWTIVCSTIDETTGAFAVVGDTVRGTGDSVQVKLIKYDFKYTYYKIAASSGNDKDSTELQVFSKGAMQKYLYKAAVYPTKPVPAYIFLPASFSPSSRPLVVMHGIDRNAMSYGLAWTSYASANNTVVIAPEFNSTDWTSSAYAQGNIFTGSDGTGSLNIKEKWSFTIVRDIERRIVSGFGLKDSSYTIWGHSAGAQFVHRMVLFAPDSMVTTAIAANAGWYTAPDSTTVFPWGVKHPFLSVKRQDLIQFTLRNLVLMRGTADTLRDSDLNIDSLSDVQGRNRYQRAGYFVQKGKEINSSLRWPLLDVAGVGHDFRKMASAAAEYLVKGTTIVQRDADVLPRSMMLLQNYPNPFNPTTAISYQLPAPSGVEGSAVSFVKLAVYDALGRKLATLVDGVKEPGVHVVHWNASRFSSGIYFCTMTAEKQTSVIKLLLMK